MPARGKKQYNLVKKLSFVRFGGTAGEEKAASIITDAITADGGSCELMPFPIPACEYTECQVSVSSPYARIIPSIPYGRSGNIDGEYELFYARRGVEEDYIGIDSLAGKVVLLDALTLDAYKVLVEKKASAFMVICNKWYQNEKDSDLLPRTLRSSFLELGRIPGFMIWARDAMEFVRRRATRFSLKLSQHEFEAASRNILACIPGTEIKDESIVITAHYDSVLLGTGSWDNATGCANILYLYKHFLNNPPRRTLRFLWCGSEEQGLLGSLAYIEHNPELAEKEIKMCINFDMCGTVLGGNKIKVTGSDDLKTYVEQFCREYGWSAEIITSVHSSDSAPFADKGIPAIGLSQGTAAAEIHTRHDLLNTISADRLQDMSEFSAAFISRVANSVLLPVETGMPDSMKEELDRFFQREKK